MIQSQRKRIITAMKSEYFCKECGKFLFRPGTINPALGIPNTWHWHKDGAGRIKCSRCNNIVR